ARGELKAREDLGRRAARTAPRVGEDVSCRAFGEEAVLLVDDLVPEGKPPRRELRQGRPDPKRVVVLRGTAVLAVHSRHQDPEARVLQRAVWLSRGPAEIRPPDLEPDDVVRVVDDPHAIRFRVTDPNGSFDDPHSLSPSRLRTASGTRPLTSPPSPATSLTRRLET